MKRLMEFGFKKEETNALFRRSFLSACFGGFLAFWRYSDLATHRRRFFLSLFWLVLFFKYYFESRSWWYNSMTFFSSHSKSYPWLIDYSKTLEGQLQILWLGTPYKPCDVEFTTSQYHKKIKSILRYFWVYLPSR